MKNGRQIVTNFITLFFLFIIFTFSSYALAQTTRPTLQSLQNQINCLTTPIVTKHLQAIDHGWYNNRGQSRADSTHGVVAYIVGKSTFQDITSVYRNFFVFDLRSILPENYPAPFSRRVEVIVARLIPYNPAIGYKNDSGDTLTYVLNRVKNINSLIDGTGGLPAFTDLADGPIYGSYVASVNNNNKAEPIHFNHTAVYDINRILRFGAEEDDYRFAVGGVIVGLDDSANDQFLFGGSGEDQFIRTLELYIKYPDALCPEPDLLP
ncbi:MAG: hypothetical protein E6Q61_07945 [Nitrosomonas sp.]|nr:MAG: hypothetical protein E6Q61_07945 [Nitrosomonas sp.]